MQDFLRFMEKLPDIIPPGWTIEIFVDFNGYGFRLEDPDCEGCSFDATDGLSLKTLQNALDKAIELDGEYDE